MTPNDAIYLLLVIVPVGLVFAKFSFPQLRWLHLWLLTPVASWLIVNLADLLDPGDGLASMISVLLGWFWSLPVLAALWMGQALLILGMPRLPARRGAQFTSRTGLHVTSAVAIAVLLYGAVGWISSERAIRVAMRHAARLGPPSQTAPHATWSWFQWRVQFPDGTFLDVSRNGRLLGGSVR